MQFAFRYDLNYIHHSTLSVFSPMILVRKNSQKTFLTGEKQKKLKSMEVHNNHSISFVSTSTHLNDLNLCFWGKVWEVPAPQWLLANFNYATFKAV